MSIWGRFGGDLGTIDVISTNPNWRHIYRRKRLEVYPSYPNRRNRNYTAISGILGTIAGAITAAQFLSEFAGDTPWVHLDIAGTYMTDKEKNYLVKGATGIPTRTLVNLVLSLAE